MRKWFTRLLFVGLAALPSAVQAQYPPRYYYPQMPVYRQPQPHPYQYYYQAAPYSMPAYSYAQPQPMPMYAPSYPMPYQSAIVEAPQAQSWQPAPMQSETHLYQPSQTIILPPAQTVKAPTQKAPALTAIAAQNSNGAGPDLLTPIVPLPPAPAVVDTPGVAKKITLPALIKPATTTKKIVPATPTANVKDVKETKEPVLKETLQPEEKIEAPLTMITDTAHGKKHRFAIFGDYLYWNVHGVDVPYAQASDGVIAALSVPRGPVAVVSPKYSSGFRLGGEFGHCEGASIVGTFTYFQNNRSSEIEAPDTLVLRNFLAFPNTANAAVDSLKASADYRIQLMMADLDYRCAIVDNEHLNLRWLAGLRYANTDLHLEALYQITGETPVIADIGFNGIGPRFGLDGQYHVHGGFYGYAQGIVDILFGQYRGTVEQTNDFTGLIGSTEITSNRVVPILEFELGMGWQSSEGRFRLQGGYYVGSWFNTITMTSLFSSIGGPNFTTNGNNFRDNMTFDGFVLRGEIRY